MRSRFIRIRKIGTIERKIRLKQRLGKKLRKLMKNRPKQGRSVRNGNSPAPYTKYNKTPYKYSFQNKVVDFRHSNTSVEDRVKQKRFQAA